MKPTQCTECIKHKQGDWIQFIGLCIVLLGFTCEVLVNAHVWNVVITAGAIIFALGTKVKGR